MKKFTTIGNTNKTTEFSDNRTDFIKNLIEESLSIENGIIKGKDILSNVFNKILDINESKTKIAILENIKLLSTRNLNIQTLNESIETEKKNIQNIKFETNIKEEKTQLLAESKDCDDCKDDSEKEEKINNEEGSKEEENKSKDGKKSKEEDEETEVVESYGNRVFITDSEYTDDILDLAKLVESIKIDDDKK